MAKRHPKKVRSHVSNNEIIQDNLSQKNNNPGNKQGSEHWTETNEQIVSPNEEPAEAKHPQDKIKDKLLENNLHSGSKK